MPTKTAPSKTPDLEVTRWQDHPLVQRVQAQVVEGKRALEVAQAQAATLEAEVAQARARLDEVRAAERLGEAAPGDVEVARTALAEAEAHLADAKEVAAAYAGALRVLQRRAEEAAAHALGEIDTALAARRRTLTERLAAPLSEAARVNRDLLAAEDLRRQNGLPVDGPLAWGELLPLAEPKVLRNKTLTFDYAVGTERCLLALWLERARGAGCAVPEVEPVALAEAVPSRFGRRR